MVLSLAEIKQKVDTLAEKINAPEYALPTYGWSEQSARPHIEVNEQGYHFIVSERGEENRHETTSDLDELLYYIFDSATFEIACPYEAKHRKRGQDFRRGLFAYQELLIGKISDGFKDRLHQRHAEVLKNYPFDDSN